MKKIKFLLPVLCLVYLSACGTSTSNTTNQSNTANNQQIGKAEESKSAGEQSNTNKSPAVNSASNQPKTIREYFMLMPVKYFPLEGCEPAKDKDCQKAKLDYLKNFTGVEDIANGYFKGDCDGAQSCLEMALFKRPDDSYLIGVSTWAEMFNENYFLEYKNGKWTDVSTQIVPQFSKKNIYELPRYGTTVKVFAKKTLESGDDYEISEKGEKLYDLAWKDGKFSIQK